MIGLEQATTRVGWAPRRRSRPVQVMALLLSVSLAISACASGTESDASSEPISVDLDTTADIGGEIVDDVLSGDAAPESITADDAGTPDEDVPAEPEPETGSTFADQIEFLGTAELDTDPGDAPVPVGLDLPTIGVTDAPVTPVGVEGNGDMEIPGASEVGWYRFGPSPGDTGSAVLAAHIAYNGVDGVFRNLADMRAGERFSVIFSDGQRREFEVLGLRQWSKLDIPLEELFARDGVPRLALITCGGTFNRALDSYDDNIVVIAVPIEVLS